MALLGLLVYVTATAYALDGSLRASPDAGASRSAAWAAGAVLALLMVGSYVSGRDAGYVFPDWPLMNGHVVPDLGLPLYAIHFFHRALAAVVGVVVAVVTLRIVRNAAALPLQARLARVALALFTFEIVLGAANIWTKLNAAVVTLHLLTGALIWGTLVGIAVVSRTGLARGETPRAFARTQPEVEMAGS
jgi:heme A synthase